jgi:four helix bundle protein
MQLAKSAYRVADSLPANERFALADQIRRAAISVPSNIAEGYGRATRGEYVQFLGHARGSAYEIETQLLLARSLGIGDETKIVEAQRLCAEVGRLLHGLIQSLRGSRGPDSSFVSLGRVQNGRKAAK